MPLRRAVHTVLRPTRPETPELRAPTRAQGPAVVGESGTGVLLRAFDYVYRL